MLHDCRCQSTCSECCDFEIETHETGGEHSEESIDVCDIIHYHIQN